MKQLRLDEASPGWRDVDTWEFGNYAMTQDDADKINALIEAAINYVDVYDNSNEPGDWFNAQQSLRNAVKELQDA